MRRLDRRREGSEAQDGGLEHWTEEMDCSSVSVEQAAGFK